MDSCALRGVARVGRSGVGWVRIRGAGELSVSKGSDGLGHVHGALVWCRSDLDLLHRRGDGGRSRRFALHADRSGQQRASRSVRVCRRFSRCGGDGSICARNSSPGMRAHCRCTGLEVVRSTVAVATSVVIPSPGQSCAKAPSERAFAHGDNQLIIAGAQR